MFQQRWRESVSDMTAPSTAKQEPRCNPGGCSHRADRIRRGVPPAGRLLARRRGVEAARPAKVPGRPQPATGFEHRENARGGAGCRQQQAARRAAVGRAEQPCARPETLAGLGGGSGGGALGVSGRPGRKQQWRSREGARGAPARLRRDGGRPPERAVPRPRTAATRAPLRHWPLARIASGPPTERAAS